MLCTLGAAEVILNVIGFAEKLAEGIKSPRLFSDRLKSIVLYEGECCIRYYALLYLFGVMTGGQAARNSPCLVGRDHQILKTGHAFP